MNMNRNLSNSGLMQQQQQGLGDHQTQLRQSIKMKTERNDPFQKRQPQQTLPGIFAHPDYSYNTQKPVNPVYSSLINQDVNLAAKDKNTALYTREELKNLDLKTDGSPIRYKPEYH